MSLTELNRWTEFEVLDDNTDTVIIRHRPTGRTRYVIRNVLEDRSKFYLAYYEARRALYREIYPDPPDYQI